MRLSATRADSVPRVQSKFIARKKTVLNYLRAVFLHLFTIHNQKTEILHKKVYFDGWVLWHFLCIVLEIKCRMVYNYIMYKFIKT